MSAVAAPADPASVWRSPGQRCEDHLDSVQSELSLAGDYGSYAPQFSDAELTAAVGSLDEAHAQVMTLLVRVVTEALARGAHTCVGLAAQDWVAHRCPGLSRQQVADVVTVARACSEPVHDAVRVSVEQSHLPVRRAAAVLRSLSQVKPAMDGEEYQQAMSTLLDVASQPRFTDRDLTMVTDRLASVALSEKEHESRAAAARQMRCVNESSLADGSLCRFIVTCDAEGAAALRAVLTSPLAAPCPQDGGADPRTAGQRRYDALLTVLRRGVAGGESTPTCAKATVMVTVAWDVLSKELAGTGSTLHGDVLSPDTVRKMACDAELIPAVLGTDGEILALGRTKRLVTPGQRRALEHRDKGCSFPWCSRPAGWTDAHHIVHWSRGGLSDLDNYTLLCGRHHTLVHERDLSATVDPSGVTWHL